jgi:hypothetical protein
VLFRSVAPEFSIGVAQVALTGQASSEKKYLSQPTLRQSAGSGFIDRKPERRNQRCLKCKIQN